MDAPALAGHALAIEDRRATTRARRRALSGDRRSAMHQLGAARRRTARAQRQQDRELVAQLAAAARTR